jgi:hypothetical protein
MRLIGCLLNAISRGFQTKRRRLREAARISAALRKHAHPPKCCSAAKVRASVDNGKSGDGGKCAVARFADARLDRRILRRWETIAEVRETERDCPDAQRHPIGMQPGDRPPVLDILRSPSNVGLP